MNAATSRSVEQTVAADVEQSSTPDAEMQHSPTAAAGISINASSSSLSLSPSLSPSLFDGVDASTVQSATLFGSSTRQRLAANGQIDRDTPSSSSSSSASSSSSSSASHPSPLIAPTPYFDPELFTSPPPDHLLCLICTGVVHSPLNLSCSHLFCSTCLTQWCQWQTQIELAHANSAEANKTVIPAPSTSNSLALPLVTSSSSAVNPASASTKNASAAASTASPATSSASLSPAVPALMSAHACPTCRAPFSLFLASPNHAIQQVIANMEVKCPNFELGCTTVMLMGFKERHVSEHRQRCPYEVVSCRYAPACSARISRRDIDVHERSSCIERRLRCDDCDEDVKAVDWIAHKNSQFGCTNMVVCPNGCTSHPSSSAAPHEHHNSTSASSSDESQSAAAMETAEDDPQTVLTEEEEDDLAHESHFKRPRASDADVDDTSAIPSSLTTGTSASSSSSSHFSFSSSNSASSSSGTIAFSSPASMPLTSTQTHLIDIVPGCNVFDAVGHSINASTQSTAPNSPARLLSTESTRSIVSPRLVTQHPPGPFKRKRSLLVRAVKRVTVVRRLELHAHLLVCPLQPVKCDLCPARMLRCELPAHVAASLVPHVLAMQVQLKQERTKGDQLRSELARARAEIYQTRRVVADISRQQSSGPLFAYFFDISPISLLCSHYVSNDFVCGDHVYYFALHRQASSFSAYLYLKTGTTPVSLSFVLMAKTRARTLQQQIVSSTDNQSQQFSSEQESKPEPLSSSYTSSSPVPFEPKQIAPTALRIKLDVTFTACEGKGIRNWFSLTDLAERGGYVADEDAITMGVLIKDHSSSWVYSVSSSLPF